MKRQLRVTPVRAAAAAILCVVVGAGAAAAVTTSDPGPFVGCLASKSNPGSGTTKGQIYNVAKSGPLAACLKGDTQVAFSNAQGPQGIQGIQGPQGSQGIQGLKGDPGDSGLHPHQYWRFDLPAGAGNESDTSAVTFPSGFWDDQDFHVSSVTSVAGTAHSWADAGTPANCAYAKIRIRISGGTKLLAEFYAGNGQGFASADSPDHLGTSDSDEDGFGLRASAQCFDENDDTIDGHPHVFGVFVFDYDEPPVEFDAAP